MQHGLRPPSSNFGLQIILILTGIAIHLWFLTSLGLMIYKTTYLPFPPLSIGLEFAGLVAVWLMEWLGAVYFGKRGNLTEHAVALAVSIGLFLLCSGGLVYYLWFQTYVMRLDLGFSAVLLGLNALCLLGAMVTMQNISSASSVAEGGAPGCRDRNN